MKKALVVAAILAIVSHSAVCAELIVKGPFELNRANSRFVQPPNGTIEVQIWAEGFTRNVKSLQIRLQFIDKDQNDRVPGWFSIASGTYNPYFGYYAIYPEFPTSAETNVWDPSYFSFSFTTAQDLSAETQIATVYYTYSSSSTACPYRIAIDGDPGNSFATDEDSRELDLISRDGHFTIGANTWIVDNNESGDFTTIQAALDAETTVDGDLVLVKDSGTNYSGAGNRETSHCSARKSSSHPIHPAIPPTALLIAVAARTNRTAGSVSMTQVKHRTH